MNQKERHLPEKWIAQWIAPERELPKESFPPASILRKQFVIEQEGESWLYATALGIYEIKLNGRRVGDFILAPGTGDYRKCLRVQAYEVSHLLKQGANVLEVSLGNGWYRGSVGIDGLHKYYGERIAFLCQLEVDHRPLVWTDLSWEASQEGPNRANDLQQGECYDARREGNLSWHPVDLSQDEGLPLIADEGVPICEQERFHGELIQTPNGDWVVDFRQNLSGYVRIQVRAKGGERICLWHGETLDAQGNFTQENFQPGDRSQNGGIAQKVEYFCKEGSNDYRPQFAIFGFRYAKVESDLDLTDPALELSFEAIAVYSRMPQRGYFSSAHEGLNQLFSNSLWSMRSNFCDVPTDCPTRERAGWTGDAALFAPTGVYLADCYPIYRKWLQECRLAQREDGRISNIAPINYKKSMISDMLQGSAGWGDACILVPWTLYQTYGKREILEENYPMMEAWMGFLRKRAAKSRIGNLRKSYRRDLMDQGFHFGEWCQPDVDNMQAMKGNMTGGATEVATAYYFRSASLLAQIAGVLGKEQEAEDYQQLADRIRFAYRREFLPKGQISSDRQCEYVRPLAFGILEEEEARAAAKSLNQMVMKNGYQLNTGFLSTPDLCRVLADYGYVDTAYRLLLQEKNPSWLYAVSMGATTIWETWDGIREDGSVHDSLNHYAYGAICAWLFGGVCGIQLSQDGLRIAPQPHPSLGEVKARWESPQGIIVSSWRYEKEALVLDMTLPVAGCVRLPDGREFTLEKGDYHYEISL